MMSEEELQAKMNYTPKERLFGNIRILETLIAKMPEGGLKKEMERRVESALSWEPLILSKEEVSE